MANISVIGSGSFGTAVGVLLANKGHKVLMWARKSELAAEINEKHTNNKYLRDTVLPKDISATSDISLCANNMDFIVLAVPSHALDETAIKLAPYILPGQIIVNIAKGFDEKTNRRLSAVIEEHCKKAVIVVMSGPSHAEEVCKGLPTSNVVASENENAAKLVQEQFSNENFRLYTNNDVLGVELGGALKNIIALCAGISDGLGYGDNTKAALMTRGMAEIIRLGVAMGANSETFSGLSGIGDLIVTCTSMHSRNRRCGILIGKGKSPDEAMEEVKMVVEGVKATKSAYELSKKYNVEMPITEATYNIIYKGKNPQEAVCELMCRNMKSE